MNARHVFHQVFVGKSCELQGLRIPVIDISVAFLHARTDEEIYVKMLSAIRTSRSWRLTAAVNGTTKASQHWQEYSSGKPVTNILFQQNDINPCIYKRFLDNLDLEQHADDFLVRIIIKFGMFGG